MALYEIQGITKSARGYKRWYPDYTYVELERAIFEIKTYPYEEDKGWKKVNLRTINAQLPDKPNAKKIKPSAHVQLLAIEDYRKAIRNVINRSGIGTSRVSVTGRTHHRFATTAHNEGFDVEVVETERHEAMRKRDGYYYAPSVIGIRYVPSYVWSVREQDTVNPTRIEPVKAMKLLVERLKKSGFKAEYDPEHTRVKIIMKENFRRVIVYDPQFKKVK